MKHLCKLRPRYKVSNFFENSFLKNGIVSLKISNVDSVGVINFLPRISTNANHVDKKI